MIPLTALFWGCASVVVYVYLGYPLLVWLLSRRSLEPELRDPPTWPKVTLLIAAYNEEKIIAEKLENSLSLDFPKERLEVLVASDGSTDRTDEIVASFQDRGVRLIRVEGRAGKTVVQNRGVEVASGEIVVFSDANALYDHDTIKWMVRHLTRDDVGCAEGRRLDYAERASATTTSELSFRNYESWIKVFESRVLSCVGATGPIYAVRRALYVPLAADMISDLMEPLMVMYRHGKRQVFEPRAISRETVFVEMRKEFRRKVRIMNRCLYSMTRHWELLNPFRAGLFAVQVISHRFLRWLLPLFLIALLTLNIFLLDRPFYRALFVLQSLFYGSALFGGLLDWLGLRPVVLRPPYYFCVANIASLIALTNLFRGRKIIRWKTER